MISQDLLQILVCPETKQRLRPLGETDLAALNSEIIAGRVKNRKGDQVTAKAEMLLVRDDNAFGYPVRDGIPIMLVDEAIAISKR